MGSKTHIDTTKLMYRSNIAGVIKTVLEVNLDERHIRQLKRTPFWLMIESIRTHNLQANTFKKCDETVCRIIQTYNPRDEKFYVGGHGLALRNSDIRLIFGIQCSKDKLDVSSSPKPTSDFMQRRCPTVGRISCKLVKDLLFDALKGRTERDEEDVAKLLCLYICATVRSTLINSLNDFHIRPEKVTGCVVALLFMICKHTNLIEPERQAAIARFCKWNVGLLICKIKGLELTSAESLQVNYDKLCGTILERYTLSVPNDDQVPV
ncbi:hypothetical protein CsSME_00046200 [Camellia sinensis var. sinensis]